MTDILQPEGWRRPSGYSNGIRATGEMLFVAGQIGWDENRRFVSEDLVGQTRRALQNIVTVLRTADSGPKDIVRLTWYVTDMDEYRSRSKEIGAAYRDVMGTHYPAMSLFQVVRLFDDGAKIEIEATAVIAAKQGP